eukprot:TRINITY_DN2115_c0_g2_i3.p1 TRINITY_DN2115_c0_g2~~TRINITY_DN2115_c0_g2_i3.p1  ORF type:complete len:245 (-),score=23.04 TRINITY_DN2115_c0_g2_i3:27-761(-)
MASSSLAFLPLNHQLLSKPIAKSHLQRRKLSSQNVGRFINTTSKMSISSNSHEMQSACALSGLAPLEAILFDVDGTLCDSDPLHYFLFREMLQEVGFNGSVPISEEFFVQNISGKHNDAIRAFLFPEWDVERSLKFIDDKEAMFLRLASQHLKPVNGIHNMCKWVEECGLKRAAVTNSRRENAELMISILGLSNFFDILVIGCECMRPKPYPEPYLKALQALNVYPNHTFVFEVCFNSPNYVVN